MDSDRPFVTAAVACEQVDADLAAIDVALTRLRNTSTDLVGHAFRVEIAARLETITRTVGGLSYRMVGELFDPPGEGPEPGVKERLARRLRVTRAEVGRRAKVAARIGPRRTLAGEVLAPELPRLAEAVAAGQVGEDHIAAVGRPWTGYRRRCLPSTGSGRRRNSFSMPLDRTRRSWRRLVRPSTTS